MPFLKSVEETWAVKPGAPARVSTTWMAFDWSVADAKVVTGVLHVDVALSRTAVPRFSGVAVLHGVVMTSEPVGIVVVTLAAAGVALG